MINPEISEIAKRLSLQLEEENRKAKQALDSLPESDLKRNLGSLLKQAKSGKIGVVEAVEKVKKIMKNAR